MTLSSRSLRLFLPALLVLAACSAKHVTRNPLDEAMRRIADGDGDARDLALAGLGVYVRDGKPDEAAKLIDRALESDPVDPWALFGRAELARRALDSRGQALTALKICEKAPTHPLCAVGARIAQEYVGDSPAFDAELARGSLAALEAGARGDAAQTLRSIVAQVRYHAGDEAGAWAQYEAAGLVRRASLIGPWSAYHLLDWDRSFPPEQGAVASDTGPVGPIAPRPYEAPDGRLALHGEAGGGDIYYWAADFELKEPGTFHARAMSNAPVRLFVDGQVVAERRPFDRAVSRRIDATVQLSAGKHRLLARVARGNQRADLWVALAPIDGSPSPVRFIPATGTFTPSAPPIVTPADPATVFPDAASMRAALARDGGPLLAAFVAARDAMGRDEEGARALALEVAEDAKSPAALILRAEATLADPSLPRRLAVGQAARDLEDATRADPGEASALQRLSILARSESRLDDAAELLARATKAASPKAWRPMLTEARIATARGIDAQADAAAERALAIEPGLCEALALRYDFARRADAVALTDELVKALNGCPGRHSRAAEHARLRGDLHGALAAWRALAESQPMDPGPWTQVAGALGALGRPQEAAAVFESLATTWPRMSLLHKRRAEALELAGDLKGARAAREKALEIDGSDLKLRRALAWEDGGEVLDEFRRDGDEVLERYRASGLKEDAAGVYILDSAAVRLNPDGSSTERTHIIAKVVDQRGVSKLAELNLPAGAEVLKLRTIKQDGRILEPEHLGGKDGISLPGVEVGDLIEYEYLTASGRRGPGLPGFSSPKFYFQIGDGQVFDAIFEVRAPKGTGLEIDPHNLGPVEISVDGEEERLLVRREKVPTWIREPGQPQGDEVLPWLQAGTGAGVAELLTSYADMMIDRSRPNLEVERFAREAAAGKSGEEAVRAVYERVMQEVKGREAMGASAAASLVQGRGSRQAVLKAALEVLGIPVHTAMVRPFSADPAAYRFPASNLYVHPVLVVSLPDQAPIFLEPSVRFAPFGQLPPALQGREAAVLPRIGESLKMVRTPGDGSADGREIVLKLALAEDGSLSGTGEERYSGFDAAYLRAGLERLDEERRRQALESSVARTFRNSVLTRFEIDEPERSGAPVIIRYEFRAPGFARPTGEGLAITRGLFPANLARRYVALASRTTPLLIGQPERVTVSAELSLPSGMIASVDGAPVKLTSEYGDYARAESLEGNLLRLDETLTLELARIPPSSYPAFVEFVTAIDRAQSREWIVRRTK